MKHWPKTLLALALGIAASSPGEAGAWFKFKNSTPNTIFAAMAHAHLKGGFVFLCGHSDGCGINNLGPSYEYLVQGWWAIAPGGTKTACGWEFENGQHYYYAEDSVGHFWGNGDRLFCATWQAFGHCGDVCPAGARSLPFTDANDGYQCCGGACGGNKTINFVL